MIYKGYELLKAIVENKIKNGSRFKTEEGEEIEWNGHNLLFTNEVIEDEIDIDSIAEVTTGDISNIDGLAAERVKNKINELVQAVKQLNKEIKELENKIK